MGFKRLLRRVVFGPDFSSRWAKIVHAATFALFMGLVGILALAEYSTRPSFCNSCHIMEPYYQSWRKSSHKDVRCVDCHYPPDLRGTVRVKYEALTQLVKYATHTYGSKPYAVVEDASCLRSGCHDAGKLPEKAAFHGKIRFPHQPHLGVMNHQRKLRCTSCHEQSSVDDHVSVKKENCFLCHFKQTERVNGRDLRECTLCHAVIPQTVQTAEGQDFDHGAFAGQGVQCRKCHGGMASGGGRVEEAKCLNCHNKREQMEWFGNPVVLHQKHTELRSVGCFNCHEEIRHEHRPAIHAFENACATCHGGMHEAARMLYSGTGGKGVPDMPGTKFRAHVDCWACHFTQTPAGSPSAPQGRTALATETACRACHGDAAEGILDMWKSDVAAELEAAKSALQAAERAYEAAARRARRPAELEKAGIHLEAARYNVRLVEQGRGVHNVDYAVALLEKSREDCEETLKQLEVTPR
jgi:nitrate/TMAO reductase-like tetraheme cytochrome c subunit